MTGFGDTEKREAEGRNDPGEVRFAARLVRSWFELTSDEQKAVLIVLVLFLLGLAACWWRLAG